MIRAAHPQCRILVAVKAPVADEKASAALLRALAGLQTTAPASFDGVYLDLAASPALSQLVAWLRPTAARPAAACYVQRAGRLILDGEGRPMQLRGMNLSGWLSWEGWLMGGGQLADSTIDARLRQVLGDVEAERFRAAYADTFIGEADIARIAKLGYNVVRVPINYRVLATPGGNGTDGWPLLDRLLDWCEQYHIYVILDLQAAPGGQSPLFTADPTAGGSLWTSPARKAETVALWKRIAQQYRDRTIVAGYDLLNEPIPSDSRALLGLYRQLVSAIRAVDPYHLLILEGSNRSRDLSLFAESLTVNQLLSFHLHQPNAAARQQLLSAYAKQSEAQHMPVWNGEFGEDGYEIVKGALVALTDPRYGIAGQCFWNWKMAPNVHPGLQLVQVSPGWIAVVAWMSLPEKYPQPTHAAALAAAHEYLTALPLANCSEDRWMAQVLAMAQ